MLGAIRKVESPGCTTPGGYPAFITQQVPKSLAGVYTSFAFSQQLFSPQIVSPGPKIRAAASFFWAQKEE
jgi:hypothetical protein